MQKFKPLPIGCLLFLSTICLYFACRKIDFNKHSSVQISDEDRFFKTNSPVHPTINALMKSIQWANAKESFIKDLTKNAGFPLWDKARVVGPRKSGNDDRQITGSGSALAFIPFAKDSANFVSAVLLAWVDSRDTALKMLYHWEYSQFSFTPRTDEIWDAQDIFNLFTYFEQTVYGHDKFLIMDTSLVNPGGGHNASILTRGTSTLEPLARIEAVEECAVFEVCHYLVPVQGGVMGGMSGPLLSHQMETVAPYRFVPHITMKSGVVSREVAAALLHLQEAEVGTHGMQTLAGRYQVAIHVTAVGQVGYQ